MPRPMVTMMIEMIGSPISGLNTTTWINTPKIVMNTRVAGKPIQNGRPRSVTTHQQNQAPTSRNSPWAKFTTWVDL